ncbi:Tc3 transposase [Phytophthora infestans]|uniref:Tc3 transposase n=1 Tax=Phytophthora infestans TaxID=4787 RepID=A0A8S9U2D9_PHYIN|nr:Tc3 transposase [Phytophthora infestans]
MGKNDCPKRSINLPTDFISVRDEERGRIKGLHEANVGVRETSHRLKRSPDGVSYVLGTEDKRTTKPGRSKSLTDRQIRQVVRGAATKKFSAA